MKILHVFFNGMQADLESFEIELPFYIVQENTIPFAIKDMYINAKFKDLKDQDRLTRNLPYIEVLLKHEDKIYKAMTYHNIGSKVESFKLDENGATVFEFDNRMNRINIGKDYSIVHARINSIKASI